MTAPESRWRFLLGLALPVLDHVFPPPLASGERPPWTLGGGTAIAVWIDHRISYDVDLFVPGVPLKQLTPAHNPFASRIAPHFQWPGHYLKFERPEGEIDFLSPALQTEPGFAWKDIDGRPIAVETPEEVIVKKIRFRSARLTARDVFDLAAVAATHNGLAETLARDVPDALARTRESLELQASRGQDVLARSVVPTPSGRAYLDDAFGMARRVLAAAADLSD
ncbi:hypothetical protein ASG40_16675 [Methylobacterium sp. Leaf399]|nr:hypothetical protein ASG40_16675 [Methylobacterium sp. Leaf399]